ncbi:olfactory receptor 5K1-like [Hoplias malabaricus]|uniref:olfactory receptor 5K1-like n=1 Tax=Hoplias malabaricus TaxID=27720 RepID=UPI003461B93E
MSLQNISGISISEFVIGGFDTVQRPLVVGVVVLIAYILVIIANLANIYFIVMDKSLHQPMYLFICNLAIVDIICCTSSCPTIISVLVAGYKTISYVPCIIQMFIYQISNTMEMFAISAMAFDRFIAISCPLRYHSMLTNGRSVLISVALWVAAFAILAIFPATILPLPFCQSTLKYMFCDFAAVIRATCVDPNPYFNDGSILFFFLMFGTFGFICLSYLKIVMVVVKMSSKSDKKKVFNTCFSHFIVIVCYYAPTFVLKIMTRIGVVLTLEERHGLMVGTIIGPSLVNPFIYCLRTKEIRQKLLKILSKVAPRS